jgi:AcrR family transcriptional regulator
MVIFKNMVSAVDGVKGPVSKMEQRSTATRASIVRAAHELFCQRGFRATTMEEIGRAAGVSVQTVYFQFRTKDQVLKAVHEWTVLGDEGLPPQSQPWHRAALEEPDVRVAVAKLAAGIASINVRVAPTLPIFATLAQEPGGEIYRRSRTLRRQGMEELVSALKTKAPLRNGMTATRAADLLDFLLGPESYAELVLRAGWSRRRWVNWVSETLADQLFETPNSN